MCSSDYEVRHWQAASRAACRREDQHGDGVPAVTHGGTGAHRDIGDGLHTALPRSSLSHLSGLPGVVLLEGSASRPMCCGWCS